MRALLLTLACCGAPKADNIAPIPGTPAVLAEAGATTVNGPVNGISCDSGEKLAFHIHAHLAVYVNGSEALIPAGIGIGPPLVIDQGFVTGGSCFSWLHTHDQTGVVHIESPIERVFTLGDLFDVWGQPLDADHAGPAAGKITAFVNGDAYAGDVRAIGMNAHDVIQLDVGTVVDPQPYTFAARL